MQSLSQRAKLGISWTSVITLTKQILMPKLFYFFLVIDFFQIFHLSLFNSLKMMSADYLIYRESLLSSVRENRKGTRDGIYMRNCALICTGKAPPGSSSRDKCFNSSSWPWRLWVLICRNWIVWDRLRTFCYENCCQPTSFGIFFQLPC